MPHRFVRDERGVILVLAAMIMTVLALIIGLGVEAGWWYALQRQNQSAADAAALSAAYEYAYKSSLTATDLTPFATAAASRNKYTGSTPAVTLLGGGQVQAVLNQDQGTWFSKLAGPTNVTIQTGAIAQVTDLPAACIMAMSGTANKAISLAGNASIEANGCTIVANSNKADAFYFQGSVSIDAATLITPGGVSYTGGSYTLTLDRPAQTGTQHITDPYASTLTHANLISGMPTAASCTKTCGAKVGSTWPGNCVLRKADVNVGDTLSAKTQICGGLAIKNGTVNLSPGVYWITDGDLDLQSSKGVLKCPSCSNGGAGVTIILTTAKTSNGTVGTLTLGSQAELTLNAPETQTAPGFNNAGMVLIQDSNNLPAGTTITSPGNAQGNASETLSGLVYFPKSDLTFQGTPNASGPQCLVVVANTISLQGTPGFSTSGCEGPGGLGLSLEHPKTVTLIK